MARRGAQTFKHLVIRRPFKLRRRNARRNSNSRRRAQDYLTRNTGFKSGTTVPPVYLYTLAVLKEKSGI
jgi:hypothetical protein